MFRKPSIPVSGPAYGFRHRADQCTSTSAWTLAQGALAALFFLTAATIFSSVFLVDGPANPDQSAALTIPPVKKALIGNRVPSIDIVRTRRLLAKKTVEKRVQKLVARQQYVNEREAHVKAALDRAANARAINTKRAKEGKLITGSIRPVITSASGLRLGTLSAGDSRTETNNNIGTFERIVDPFTLTKDTKTLGAVEIALLRTEKAQIKELRRAHAKTSRKAKKLASMLRRHGLKVPKDTAIGGPLIELKSGDKFLDTLGALDASLQQLASLRNIAQRVPAGSPVPGQKVSSRYGTRTDPFTKRRAVHGGLDFRARSGIRVQATAAGVVVYAGRKGGYGKLVEIDHGNGVTTRYAHLSKINVSTGMRVKKGQRVGKVGSTGRSTGPHLHYEVRRHGKTMDPLGFVNLGPKLRRFL